MNKTVTVIGLGYIGLPTSALIASKGTKVLGVDVKQNVVDTINQGKIHIVEPELDEIVFKAVTSGYLKATTKVQTADVYLIVVPTPFKGNYIPDISYIESVTKDIIPLLKKDDLCIIESTSPVGTTDKVKNMIFQDRPELEGNIHIAYCPERVLPGNIIYELVENDRVIGGINKVSTDEAIKFYAKYVKGKLHPTDSRTAEMCKLVENSSRDVQIAFANELSLICEKADVNVWELINLANKHPRVNILQPGCGVGGHCIAVDPYFLVSDYPEESKIIGKAREINNYKSLWCVEKIRSSKLEFELENNKAPIIALMGLTFKPNIDDLRESPALFIARQFMEEVNTDHYLIVEPNITSYSKFKLTNYQDALTKADIIVFLVGHKEFRNLKIDEDKIIIDFCGIHS